MFNNLYAAANEIRTLLMPFAFVLCVIGIGEMGWRAGSDTRAVLGALIKTIIIVALIAAYPAMMETGQEAFLDIRRQFTDARDAKFVQLLRSHVENQPSDSLTELGKIVPAAIGYFFQGIGRFMLLVLRFFQEFAIAGLIAVSPLLIGFLFFSYTQSLAVHFGVTSLTVLLWHVAICLVDIVIVAISELLFGPITRETLVLSGPSSILVQNWLLFPFVMAFATIITVFFYLSVPFVAGAIMKGLSGTTAALQAGVQGSLQAAGLVVGAGLTAAGAAATLGRLDRRPGGPCRDTGSGGRRKRGGTHRQRLVRFRGGHGARCSAATACSPDSTAKWQLKPPGFEQCGQRGQSGHGRPSNRAQRIRRGRSGSRHGLPSSRQHFHALRGPGRVQLPLGQGAAAAPGFASRPQTRMKLSAVSAITNNLVAARFWMLAAITFAALAAVAPYLTVRAMKQKEKVVILDPGGTMIYSPLLGFEEAGQLHAYHVRLACLALLQRNPVGPDLPDLLKRIYLEPARKKAAAMYQTRNEEFAEKQIHQKVEITKIDILDSRKINDNSGQTYEAVNVRAQGNLIRTGTVNKLEFREPVKFQIELLFIRNPDLLGNGRLPLVVQDFKYSETPL